MLRKALIVTLRQRVHSRAEQKKGGRTLSRHLYRTGQLASKASVTVRTLHYYDRAGLLSPSKYTESGHRLYTDEDLLILALKRLGLSLEQIQRGLHAGPDWLAQALARQKAALRQERDRLNATLQAIDAMIDAMEVRLSSSGGDGDMLWDILVEATQGRRAMANGASLSEALQRLREQLVANGRGQFVALLEEGTVREAVRVAQAAYAADGGGNDYVRSVIGPLLQEITEQGAWPPNAELDAFYEMADKSGVTYQGLGLSLEIWTPDQAFKGFSLPVLDVWYGRWVE
jgi:DNA-binding transcriptional MerR regulator